MCPILNKSSKVHFIEDFNGIADKFSSKTFLLTATLLAAALLAGEKILYPHCCRGLGRRMGGSFWPITPLPNNLLNTHTRIHRAGRI